MLEKTRKFREEFKNQTLAAIITALGLVIALSWQDVIKKAFNSIPKKGILIYHPYLADVYSALIITALSVIAILILSKWHQSQQA